MRFVRLVGLSAVWSLLAVLGCAVSIAAGIVLALWLVTWVPGL